jgi:hypothetical protein
MHSGLPRLAVVAIVACGCGRLGFEARSLAGDAVPDDDAPLARRPCGPTNAAPDPLTVEGRTFEFLDFDNNRSPLVGATVQAFDAAGTLVGSTTSIANGKYVLSIATAGDAPTLRIRYTLGGFFSTTTYFDAPLDHDIALGDQANLTPSDGPLWSAGAMGSIYASVGEAIDSARSTMNIVAQDCSDQPLAGVSISIDTTPTLATYLDDMGRGDASATATGVRYPNLIIFNAPPVATTITATASGLEFAPQTWPILAGDENTRIIVRPLL